MIKLDVKKVYDRIHWPFLLQVFTQYDFHPKFISWVISCTQHPQFALLLNGIPTQQFKPSRGLRQGCPLFPYLFVLYIEVFFNFLNFAIQNRLIKAYQSPRGGPMFLYIFFVDECSLVAQVVVRDAGCLKAIIDAYCSISSQAINLAMSQMIFSPATPRMIKDDIKRLIAISENRGMCTTIKKTFEEGSLLLYY